MASSGITFRRTRLGDESKRSILSVLIEEFLPSYDIAEFHEISVGASTQATYEAIREVNFARSIPIAGLFLFRALPRLFRGERPRLFQIDFDFLLNNGFVLLAESAPNELVVGAVGKFWLPDSGIREITPREFVGFEEPGYAKATMNFAVHPGDDGATLLTTETRVKPTDDSARRKFLWYWRLIGPFSGAIRIMMLRMIKRAAENRITSDRT
jgi:hypothetical protein